MGPPDSPYQVNKKAIIICPKSKNDVLLKIFRAVYSS